MTQSKTTPNKDTVHKQELITLPEFQSSTPVFGQSANPIDMNMAVQNRFTGAEGIATFDNLAGGNAQQDVVFEIPFDIKGVLCFTMFRNSTWPSGASATSGICTGFSTKPFSQTIQTFNDGNYFGNINGQLSVLTAGVYLPGYFVAQGVGCASDNYYALFSSYNFRVYPLSREDRRVTLRCDIKTGRKAFCTFTFL